MFPVVASAMCANSVSCVGEVRYIAVYIPHVCNDCQISDVASEVGNR